MYFASKCLRKRAWRGSGEAEEMVSGAVEALRSARRLLLPRVVAISVVEWGVGGGGRILRVEESRRN